jgi:hypothetical protein
MGEKDVGVPGAELVGPYREGRRNSGSRRTRRWRERDSNPRSPVYGELAAPGRARHDPRRHRESPERRSGRVDELAERFVACLGCLSHGQRRPRARDRLRMASSISQRSFSPSRQRSRSVATIGFVTRIVGEGDRLDRILRHTVMHTSRPTYRLHVPELILPVASAPV